MNKAQPEINLNLKKLVQDQIEIDKLKLKHDSKNYLTLNSVLINSNLKLTHFMKTTHFST